MASIERQTPSVGMSIRICHGPADHATQLVKFAQDVGLGGDDDDTVLVAFKKVKDVVETDEVESTPLLVEMGVEVGDQVRGVEELRNGARPEADVTIVLIPLTGDASVVVLLMVNFVVGKVYGVETAAEVILTVCKL